METGPHHVYVLEVVVWNVWGLVMGDGTLENLRSTRPLSKSSRLRITLSDSLTTSGGVQANMLRVMQSLAFFVPPDMRFLL